jgi:hypothetical protein
MTDSTRSSCWQTSRAWTFNTLSGDASRTYGRVVRKGSANAVRVERLIITLILLNVMNIVLLTDEHYKNIIWGTLHLVVNCTNIIEF